MGVFEQEALVQIRDQEATQRALQIYAQNLGLLLRVLGSLGVPSEDSVEYLHDFVLDILPKALASYDSNIGHLEPWLRAVFRNHVRWKRQRSFRLQARLVSLEGERFSAAIDASQEAQIHQLCEAVSGLPEPQRSVVSAMFTDDARSIREVAVRSGSTRHVARRRLREGLALLVARLDTGLLNSAQRRVCEHRLGDQLPWAAVAERSGLTEHQARSVLARSLDLVSDLI